MPTAKKSGGGAQGGSAAQKSQAGKKGGAQRAQQSKPSGGAATMQDAGAKGGAAATMPNLETPPVTNFPQEGSGQGGGGATGKSGGGAAQGRATGVVLQNAILNLSGQLAHMGTCLTNIQHYTRLRQEGDTLAWVEEFKTSWESAQQYAQRIAGGS